MCSPAGVTILGRNPERVAALVDDLRAKSPGAFELGDLSADIGEAMAGHDVIIQGTPVGMEPERGGDTCVPPETLLPEHVVFDMVYTPGETRLMADAQAAGSTVVYGMEMLLNQAALQFERWTGEAAPLAAMRASVSD